MIHRALITVILASLLAGLALTLCSCRQPRDTTEERRYSECVDHGGSYTASTSEGRYSCTMH